MHFPKNIARVCRHPHAYPRRRRSKGPFHTKELPAADEPPPRYPPNRTAKFASVFYRSEFGFFYYVPKHRHLKPVGGPGCRSPPFPSVFSKKQMGGRKVKNYRDSDYELNKYREFIVYKFADGIVEITLEDFLR